MSVVVCSLKSAEQGMASERTPTFKLYAKGAPEMIKKLCVPDSRIVLSFHGYRVSRNIADHFYEKF